MKRIFYGITLVIAIVMCLSLLFFPILKFDREAIYNNNKEYIENNIAKSLEIDSSLNYDDLKEAGIDDIIKRVFVTLQLYATATSNGAQITETNEIITVYSNEDAIQFDFERIKTKGIRYIDLANSIKNQFEYNNKLNKAIKQINGKTSWKIFFDLWSNPLPMIFLVLLIAFEFASAVIVIIRSIKGIFNKKNKLFTISIFGLVISGCLLVMPTIFKSNIDIEAVNSISEYVNVFAMSIKGTTVCYCYLVGFAICLVLAFINKLLKD